MIKIKRNIPLLFLIIFFHNLIFAYTIERLFWQERGMNVDMVIWCEVIYAVTIICLEFPSGLFADRFGRKQLIVISGILSLTEIVIITFANNFIHFAIAVFLAGISTAFTSGAYNALLYDTLVHTGKSGKFEKTLGRINAVDFTASVIAALCGGLLASYLGLVFNYYMSIVSCALALIFACLLCEPPSVSESEEVSSLKDIIKSAVSFFRSHTKILAILLNAVLVAACINYVYEFWQLYIEGFSFPIAFYGVVSASFSIVVIPVSLLPDLLLKRLNHTQLILIASFICGVGILFAAVTQNIIGIFGLAAACTGNALIDPAATGYLHRHADDKARATIESVISLGERFTGIIIGLIFGYISAVNDINIGFIFIGVLIIVSSLIFTVLYHFAEKRL